MGIPQRLQAEIFERLKGPQIGPQIPVAQPKPEPLPTPLTENPYKAVNEWQLILTIIEEEITDIPDRLQTLHILEKIINNLINSPSNPLFRKIKLTNPNIKKTIGCSKGAISFLVKIGFTLANEELNLTEQNYSIFRLKDSLEAILTTIAANEGIYKSLFVGPEETTFNPYKSSVVSFTKFQDTKAAEYDVKKTYQEIHSEISLRQVRKYYLNG